MSAYDHTFKKLFLALDQVPHGDSDCIFKKAIGKEFYETKLMFIHRKRQAAQYHHNAVLTLQKADDEISQKAATEALEKMVSLKSSTSSISHIRTVQEYCYELSAFLAALRSALDFLAKVVAFSIPEMQQVDSISSFIKKVDDGESGFFLDDLKAHLEWVLEVREYRDEVVHRSVMDSPNTGWHVSHKGKSSVSVLPILIPRHKPVFVFDTRRSRCHDMELPVGFYKSETHGAITYNDGSVEVLEHTEEYLPTDDYVEIDVFMEQHLQAFDDFFDKVLNTILDSNFKVMKI